MNLRLADPDAVAGIPVDRLDGLGSFTYLPHDGRCVADYWFRLALVADRRTVHDMRFKGVHHIELSVLDYEASVEFFDRMFGWLGYTSFWTLDLGYRSTYYMARFPFFHSYIGIQPARSGGRLSHAAHATGIHHVALWARSRREIDDFHREFLLTNTVPVSDPPAEYPLYTPGYYAVFFDDPITGIHFELSHTPTLPSLPRYLAWLRALRAAWREHPEWRSPPWQEAMRRLPSRRQQT